VCIIGDLVDNRGDGISNRGWCSAWMRGLGKVLGDGATGGRGEGILLGISKGHLIGERTLGSGDALWIPVKHDLDLETEDALTEEDVTDGVVDEIFGWLTGMDHQAIHKFHGFGTLSTQLSRHDHLASLCTRLHDIPDDTITGTASWESREEFEAKRLALSDGRQATVFHLFCIQLNGTLGKAESFLNDGREFTDATSILPQDLLSACGTDDDFGALGCDAHFNARVAILGEETGQEFIQFSIKDTIGDKLKGGRKIRFVLETCHPSQG
jgi:hypothetical protein